MGDFFLVVRIFYRKPLETDNGIRLFSSIIRDERYFFQCRIFFARYFLARYFFPRNRPAGKFFF